MVIRLLLTEKIMQKEERNKEKSYGDGAKHELYMFMLRYHPVTCLLSIRLDSRLATELVSLHIKNVKCLPSRSGLGSILLLNTLHNLAR